MMKKLKFYFGQGQKKDKGYAEVKPISKFKYVDDNIPIYGGIKSQATKRLIPKNCKIWKVNTNILGDPYYIEKESDYPKDILD
ncbi:hypothetical protein [Companilactobacillus zhachilii]|uniref:hypothetical protein n=1 Tax=Companilactobacillus zhachilii TaxID=2304606 RepID=UPI0040346375